MACIIKIGKEQYDADRVSVYDIVREIKSIKHRLPRSNAWKKYVAYLNLTKRHADLRDANHFYYTKLN